MNWEKAVSVLAGNVNSNLSYLITTVKEVESKRWLHCGTPTCLLPCVLPLLFLVLCCFTFQNSLFWAIFDFGMHLLQLLKDNSIMCYVYIIWNQLFTYLFLTIKKQILFLATFRNSRIFRKYQRPIMLQQLQILYAQGRSKHIFMYITTFLSFLRYLIVTILTKL